MHLYTSLVKHALDSFRYSCGRLPDYKLEAVVGAEDCVFLVLMVAGGVGGGHFWFFVGEGREGKGCICVVGVQARCA